MTTSSNTSLPQDLAIPESCKPLEQEIRTYVRELPRLLADGEANRFALIKGDEVISIWDTQRDAIQAGSERYGLEPFAAKKIDPRDVKKIEQLQAQEAGPSCPS
jgi:hypothetical protein